MNTYWKVIATFEGGASSWYLCPDLKDIGLAITHLLHHITPSNLKELTVSTIAMASEEYRNIPAVSQDWWMHSGATAGEAA